MKAEYRKDKHCGYISLGAETAEEVVFLSRIFAEAPAVRCVAACSGADDEPAGAIVLRFTFDD